MHSCAGTFATRNTGVIISIVNVLLDAKLTNCALARQVQPSVPRL